MLQAFQNRFFTARKSIILGIWSLRYREIIVWTLFCSALLLAYISSKRNSVGLLDNQLKARISPRTLHSIITSDNSNVSFALTRVWVRLDDYRYPRCSLLIRLPINSWLNMHQ